MSAGYKRRSLALTRTLDGSQFKVESRRPLAALSFACCEKRVLSLRRLSPAATSFTSFNAENVTRLLPRDSPNYPMFHIFTRRATLPESSQFSKGTLYNTTCEWTTSDQRAASPLNLLEEMPFLEYLLRDLYLLFPWSLIIQLYFIFI